MDILVLGATGNTGSEVVAQLAAKQADFGVMVRSATSAAPLAVTPEQIRVADFGDIDAMTKAMAGVRAIYVSMPVHPSNAQWQANILAAATAAKVSHVVKLSGIGANGSEQSEIIRTHAITDANLKASGLDWTLVQPNSFFQNLFGCLEPMKQMGKIFLPMADAKQSVVDIRDVAAVAVAALTENGHAGETYLLSGPESLSFNEQAQRLSAISGKAIDYVAVSPADAEAAMQQAGFDKWTAAKLAEILAWFAQGHYAQVTNDVERATGKPARRFDDFAAELATQL